MPSYVRGQKVRRLSDPEIYRLYVEDLLDSDTIGAAAGCSSTTVLNIVRENGGVVRPPGGQRRNPTFLIPPSEMIRRYREGQSGPKVAQAAGTSTGTLYRMLRANGVTIRPTPSLIASRKRRGDG